MNRTRVVFTIIGALAFVSAIDAATLEELNVMALGPLDGRAVVKSADGKMQVLKIGDTIPGTQATVKQVLTDRLVVEETIDKDGRTVKQTVWIYKPTKPGGKSRVQRLDREGPPRLRGQTLTYLERIIIEGLPKNES